jgi:hypothetical protein
MLDKLNPTQEPTQEPTLAWGERNMKSMIKKEFEQWWEDENEPRYRGICRLTAVSNQLVDFKRSTTHRLLAAKSGHGDFAAY